MAKTKKRAAKKTYRPKDKDGFLPQRTTKDITAKHASQETDKAQHRKAMDELGNNEQGKELFDFVLKGMIKPDKK